MPWTIADIPPQGGRVAVVTGANGGLGLATALALAGRGAQVVLAARNPDKTATARARILAAHPDAVLDVVALDLASLASVAEAATRIRDRFEGVDLLINNAGLMATPEQRTEDGFELQLGVNHLGHWALTAQLMPALLAAGTSRIVSVTSTAHHVGRALDPQNPHLRGTYDPWRAYAQSKLANYHFAIGLQHEFAVAGVGARSLVAHPGLARTDLQVRTRIAGGTGRSGRFFERLAASIGMSPEAGALPLLRAAADPRAPGGALYAPRYVNVGPPVRRPILRRVGLDQAIRTLWDVSECETGLRMQVARAG